MASTSSTEPQLNELEDVDYPDVMTDDNDFAELARTIVIR
jgi:hypothetical protein